MNALITISVLAIVILYLGLFKAKSALLPVTVVGLIVALGFSVAEWNADAAPIYNGMMLFDNFAVAFSVITIVSTILILLLSKDYFENISSNVAEYYTIILFALAGIVVMVSYHNLSMLFIGIEIMSVSLYILAGIKKRDFGSNEAALKYFLMGAFSTGFLLFGITLIYGATGSFDLEQIKSYVLSNPQGVSSLFYSGILLMIVALCFKVGAAPFHFWVPDVYEGSPTLITTFMSTVVKTAGFAAFLRIFAICFAPLHDFWMPVLLVITIITLFVGNITAVYQQSFKRMLAYSSISHVGYMLFAIVALGKTSGSAVFLYAAAYSLAYIIAFGILILLQRQAASDTFESFNGLSRKNPYLAFTLSIAMLSLAGIPLTVGFIGKFMMFSRALSEYHVWLVVLAVINAVIGIFYYLRVIVAMYFKDTDRAELSVPSYYKIVLGISAAVTILLGVYPGFLTDLI
ncbi:NADH-quinone oxidoreductase subunit N [Rubrolithibacter danxiaensis]|uniref:NADH-quinone oxidoreductase subunit N n=1 Tax=Rubrolithibacter danxiaensis TaxID=3390805 RepID=UPI003BF7F3E2